MHKSQILLRSHMTPLQRAVLFSQHSVMAVQSQRFKSGNTKTINTQPDSGETQSEQIRKIFAKDSTYKLIKKLYIYKMMSSNLFINHSLTAMNVMYKTAGVKFTNLLVNKTAGEVFTSGETIKSLIQDIEALEKSNIGGVANYVAEGLHVMDESIIQHTLKDLMDSIEAITHNKPEGGLAIKLTALISIDIMTRVSKAQEKLLEDILQVWTKPEPISKNEIQQGFSKQGVQVSEDELNWFMAKIKLPENNSDMVTQIERYANTHILPLVPSERHPFLIKLCKHFGVTDSDLQYFDTFAKRVIEMTAFAHQRNCLLYVDAEQTYMQREIDSIAAQLTQRFNRGEKTIIMNGFQNYLKITAKKIPLEIQTSRKLGYNLGIKLIRGAYMNEERRLAQEGSYESPICETIQDTHNTYNTNLHQVLEVLGQNERILIGSHNLESVEIAKTILRQRNIIDGRAKFGQLKGFSDQITGQLANEGFTVIKYLPYGPTEKVMPYLVRRGQESKQVLREQKFQNDCLKGEIKRRMSFSK